jgi:hypothetical protein
MSESPYPDDVNARSYEDHSSFEWHVDGLDGNHSDQRPVRPRPARPPSRPTAWGE